MVIQHNLQAHNTNRMYNIVIKSVAKDTEKLSSGYRINRAADDAAGLSISEKMRKQIRGLEQAARNSEDGISLVQTADGAIEEVTNMLQRMNELCVQAANGTNSETDRQSIQDEIDQIVSEIDRVSETTKFNEIYVLKGDETKPKKEVYITDYREHTETIQYINAGNISNYSSYVDGTGRTHYKLGKGVFEIANDVKDVVLDIEGNSRIQDTTLTNVSIECQAGTTLAIKDVEIDNSTYNAGTTGGVGSAIAFLNGKSTLNCYGDNKLYGGVDNYGVRAGCGVELRNQVDLTINGTDTSTLEVDASGSINSAGKLSSSYGIGTIYNKQNSVDLQAGTAANLTINSGYIHLKGMLGGYHVKNIEINGGHLDNTTWGQGISFDDCEKFTVNGGKLTLGNLSFNPSANADVIINDGTINLSNGLAVITTKTFTQNGGSFYIDSLSLGSASLSFRSEVHLNGGSFISKSINSLKMPYDFNGVSPLYINGVLTTPSYITDANNDRVFEYNNPVPSINYPKTCSPDISDPVGEIEPLYDNNGKYVSAIRLKDYFDEKGEYMGGLFKTNMAAISDEIKTGKNSEIYDYIKQNVREYNQELDINIHAGADSTSTNKINISLESLSATSLNLELMQTHFINIVDDTGDKATDAIDVIAAALKKTTSHRSYLGAIQNRLEHTVKNLDNVVENTTAAESQIRDTDMAKQMVSYSNNNILQQAGQSMLSQANQSNQGILSLLQR